MTMKEVEVDGVRLAFRESGEPGARPAVLLHALGEDSSTWTHVAGQLSADHHVHAFDLRGHGGSQRTEHYSLELMRDDVLGAMSQLGLTDVDPIGHSLGGMVAYLMTAAHPENVRRLILEEAPPPLPAHPPREVPAPPPGELAFDWTVVPDLMTQRNDPDPGWWDAVCAINVPTLVIAGGPDSHVDQAQLAAMADRMPQGEITTIASGHDVHATNPTAFTQAVQAFLR
ncbi:MAG: alpha/beta fold hydrolase [Iamia sp.]